MARSRLLVKALLGLVVIGGVGVLFVRSVQKTQSQPYTVDPANLTAKVALVPAPGPADPMLVLELPSPMAGDLFHQVFSRSNESLFHPAAAFVPLILQGEFERALARAATPDTLLAAARTAGLDSLVLVPRCLAVRRLSVPGSTSQVYFVLFDAPAVGRFRDQIASTVTGGGSTSAGFEPAALSPVMFVAASDPAFGRWLPLRADPQVDCVAPVVSTKS